MKKLFLILVLFLLVFLVSCKQIEPVKEKLDSYDSSEEEISPEKIIIEDSSEEIDVEEGLGELEDLDDLDLDEDFNFDELDNLDLE